MAKNLVIVESPTKAKTIEGFLGKEYTVKASQGHVRDLNKNTLSVDIDNNFEPEYEIPDDKKNLVAELRKLSKAADTVWLASDEDREGESISWHLYEVLDLKKKDTKRIVFHEITKSAITNAIENPRDINMGLVNAQQARRVLDRLVGYELSPLLWKKVKPSLSAGRVQSVAVRLIVEREEEIKNFVQSSAFRITAQFTFTKDGQEYNLSAELPHRFENEQETRKFLESCINAAYKVDSIEKKPTVRYPAPPFTTSTLQQEAARKLGFSVANTMRIAQQLYESGKITYMRTDSVNLSSLALGMAKKEIEQNYGAEYVKTRQYHTKSKGAQEAHEAIRPTYLNQHTIKGTADERRLYELIWKRTIASQMADAQMERTNVNISVSTNDKQFVATGEAILFDGFLKVYRESYDDTTEEDAAILPPIEVGTLLDMDKMEAQQRYTRPPFRYNEASLVKKMEELGIGRPSTYAPTISTIQKREYVTKGDVKGTSQEFQIITLKNNKITEKKGKENIGTEKGKLLPTDIGILVNKFLLQYFESIIDYNFTANVEKEFDQIEEGQREWNAMIRDFYTGFHNQVISTTENSGKFSGEKLLGIDPATGKKVYVKVGRFGPVAQIGDTESDEKPRFAGLKKDMSIESVTLEEVLKLFDFPRILGDYEGKEITVAVGRFGPYIRHDNKFYSLAKTDNPALVEYDRAVEIINEKRQKDLDNIILTFDQDPDLRVLNGRFGPYIAYKKTNYKIPKGTEPSTLSYEDCMAIIEDPKNAPKKKVVRKKS
ncbi:MAG: type I DNA topoisomerase [Bacteroidales bacterium]|nr:type I DNA topoisomerase [Bacteroidales bacterium]MBR6931164.1 type I DNA topoisomerase [Bacteroidales bacterium]